MCGLLYQRMNDRGFAASSAPDAACSLRFVIVLDRNAPIGIFDSGIGGLTVLDAIHARLPGEDLIYLGDTARLPYGTKTPDCVRTYALSAAHELVGRGIKCLVVACNTATAHALPLLRSQYPEVRVIGVVEPGAQAAAQAAAGEGVLVLATSGTVDSGAYTHALRSAGHTGAVRELACPMFVALAEEGWLDGPVVEAVVREYLSGLTITGPVLLGCTHFPPFRTALARALPGGTRIVDSATTTAEAVAAALADAALLRSGAGGGVRCFVTDGPRRFSELAPIFCPRAVIGEPELVTLSPHTPAG